MSQLKNFWTKTKHKYPLTHRFRKRCGYHFLKTYSPTNPARLIAFHSRLLLSHLKDLQKRTTRQKKFAFAEKQALKKPPHNLNTLNPPCSQERKGTLARRKDMIDPAKLTTFYPRLRCLHKWRRQKKQTHRNTLVLKVAQTCRKPLQNSNPLTPVLSQGRRRDQAW